LGFVFHRVRLAMHNYFGLYAQKAERAGLVVVRTAGVISVESKEAWLRHLRLATPVLI
jgi:hypothetical protein